MNAALYDIIHSLALDITNASATENDQAGLDAYDTLKKLCHDQESSDLDHPLQWEALGDFSEDHLEANEAYQKGLNCAIKLALPEYCASLKLAMAERFFEQQMLPEAQRLALEASSDAENIDDDILKQAIKALLNDIDHH